MSPIIEYLFANLVPGLIIALLTSVCTVKLALKRFYEEKWWERKHQVYSDLLVSLHHLKTYASEQYDCNLMGEEFNEEKSQELSETWKKYSSEVAKHSDLASFQLSDNAVKILDDYNKKRRNAENQHDILDWIGKDLEAVTECLDKLKAEAKKDLKVG